MDIKVYKEDQNSPKPAPRPSRALLLLLVTVVIASFVWLYAGMRPLEAPDPAAPANTNNAPAHIPSAQKQSSAPDPANESYFITDLRKYLLLTNEEEKFLRKYNYIKSYLDSFDETERKYELERIKGILEKLRCRKETVEGIFLREDHGANSGYFDIKTRNGGVRGFYWGGSWGHPTLIMEGSFIPLDFKTGEKIKVYFCDKTTAVGIFK